MFLNRFETGCVIAGPAGRAAPASPRSTARQRFPAIIAALSLAIILTPAGAWSQGYPSRTVRMIVPYGVGGTVDIFARSLAQKLSESMGQPFVVENMAGANGVPGSDVAARAPKDGHTLLMVASNHTVNPAIYRKVPFDPARDFSGISMVGSVVQVLSVHSGVPAQSVNELIALARSRPGQLNFASTGTGSPTHLYGELLKSVGGIDVVHVPYKAAGPALTALLSGEVTMSFLVMTSVLPQAKAGRVRPLAVVGTKRSSLAPEIPTLAEAGLSGFDRGSWVALIAPAGVPREIIGALNAEVRKALEARDLRDRLVGQGVDVFASSPDEVDATIRADMERWSDLIRKLGLKPE